MPKVDRRTLSPEALETLREKERGYKKNQQEKERID